MPNPAQATQATPSAISWHAETTEAVAARLQADPASGLTSEKAQERLHQYGPNRLIEKPRRSLWLKLFDQFRSVIVLVLLGTALLAGAVGDLKDAIVIVVVVTLNALLGFYQERRADASLQALSNMLAPTARVRRGGTAAFVAAEELVPGDVLLLEAGDRISADGRVLKAFSAEVAEAALTGESQAVAKVPEPVATQAALTDRANMVYMNTVVTRGRLEAMVVETGMATEIGRVAELLAGAPESPTPLQIQLDRLGKRMTAIAGGVTVVIFAIGFWRGDGLVETAMTAIALAVASIPEGLPAVVTVTLALGMRRMAQRNAIVRKMSAVETLGSTSVICTDKTGTLTLSQMTARRLFALGKHFSVSGEGYATQGEIIAEEGEPGDLTAVLIPAVLCTDSRIHEGRLIGDPTEGALLSLGAKFGMNAEELVLRMPRIAEIPFDSAHKFMATFHTDGGIVRMLVKGAPDVLLARSDKWLTAGGDAPMDEQARAAFVAENAAMANQAMRVMALAGRDIHVADFNPSGELMRWAGDLTLTGLAGIIDPPRPEAKDAIRVCREAGVEVKMITGDHPATAAAIARELGLSGEAHEGSDLDGLNREHVAGLVARTSVFARVTPEHKMRIVESLQARGQVVAMTGDGVNDAPALKTADIGIAMGVTGTEVTKEAAVMVLTDDNFATIVGAIKEGRIIYDNIVKFVSFQLSTNFGAILTVLGAPLFGFPAPFTAIHILWVNIIMDGPPAMTLGVDPARDSIMQERPRAPDEAILSSRRLLRVGFFGLLMAVGTLGMYAWGEYHGGHEYAITLAFTTFVFFQFFNIFNARAERQTAFNHQFFANGKLWLSLLAVLVLQVVVVEWSVAQPVFDTIGLDLVDWGLAVAVASSVLALEEMRKLTLRFRSDA